jgi:integrase
MSKSTKKKHFSKPYPTFPLTPHPTGRWCKKIKGKIYYFGKLDDWQSALELYQAQAADLHAGREPRMHSVNPEGLVLADLCNAFLTVKSRALDNHEISPRTFQDYHQNCAILLDVLGTKRLANDVGPRDFEILRAALAKRYGPVRLNNTIQYIKSVFKFGEDEGLIKKVVYGQSFKKVSKKVLRLEKAKKGPRMFESHEIRAVLDVAGVELRAMALLAVNAGLGNTDLGRLPESALDLKNGWLNYPRPKTGIDRRCPLWKETTDAIKAVIAARPVAKDEAAGLLFVTKDGAAYIRVKVDGNGTGTKVKRNDLVTREFGRLLKKLGINGERGFYCLRHSHRTASGESRDQAACDHIMGHESPHMRTTYTHGISDERLKAVVDHVHKWLFGSKQVTPIQ